MSSSEKPEIFPFVVLSVVKHDYVPIAMAHHPRFVPVVVADDASAPGWVHERNQHFANEYGIPYLRDVPRALREFGARVAVVSSEAERHCDLSIRAANSGLHIVQDKPVATRLEDCDRLVEAVERNDVRFLLWNRNYLPAIRHAKDIIDAGEIGTPRAIHVDFWFAKDSGPAAGSRAPEDPPIEWLARQIEAHADGSDGGVGVEPLGELAIEGIYPLGYVQELIGRRVERVFAVTTSCFHQVNVDNDVEDLATVTLELEGGVTGSLALGRIGAASHPDIGEIKVRVVGTKGGLVVSEARPEVSVYYRDQPPLEFRNRRIANDNDWLLAETFARAIDGEGGTGLDVRASRDILATVLAATESGRSGLPVEPRRETT